jgi:hypothetical protein
MPRSRAAAAAILLTVLGGCVRDAEETCPGEALGTLSFSGTLASRPSRPGDPPPDAAAPPPLDAAVDPAPDLPDCEAVLKYPATLEPLTATLSTSSATGAAALCTTAARAQPLFGSLAGGALLVETRTGGAVLGDCAPECVAEMTLSIRGTVGSSEGVVTSFDGALVEALVPAAGSSCGGCVLPCAARYRLTSLPPAAEGG